MVHTSVYGSYRLVVDLPMHANNDKVGVVTSGC